MMHHLTPPSRRCVVWAMVLGAGGCPAGPPHQTYRDATAPAASSSVFTRPGHFLDAPDTVIDAHTTTPEETPGENADANEPIDNADPSVDNNAPDTWGVLPTGLRDRLQWPFDATSPWNTPLGDAAVLRPAGIQANSEPGYPTAFVQDEEIIAMTPSAPAVEVRVSDAGWTGANRCSATGGFLQTVRLPDDFVVPNSGENNSAAFLDEDGETVHQNQPFTRCAAGGSATALVKFSPSGGPFGEFPDVNIRGQGITGAHGGSGLSALGGSIRVGELTSGRIHHAMKVNLWAQDYYHCCSPIWPATTVDGYASSSTYGGELPFLAPGALLALPSSFDETALRTTPGQIIARAFKEYGAYVVDDTFWNAWALCTETGPAGRVTDEFEQLYGFSMRPDAGTPFMDDIEDIFSALHVVIDNSEQNIGGAGARRAPLAPAIGG